MGRRFRYPIEYTPTADEKNQLVEVPVPGGSIAIGRQRVDMGFPVGALVVLIRRDDDVFVPRGNTRIEAGDVLLVLAERGALEITRAIVNAEAPDSA